MKKIVILVLLIIKINTIHATGITEDFKKYLNEQIGKRPEPELIKCLEIMTTKGLSFLPGMGALSSEEWNEAHSALLAKDSQWTFHKLEELVLLITFKALGSRA